MEAADQDNQMAAMANMTTERPETENHNRYMPRRPRDARGTKLIEGLIQPHRLPADRHGPSGHPRPLAPQPGGPAAPPYVKTGGKEGHLGKSIVTSRELVKAQRS